MLDIDLLSCGVGGFGMFVLTLIIIYEYVMLIKPPEISNDGNEPSQYTTEPSINNPALSLIRVLFLVTCCVSFVSGGYGYVLAATGIVILEMFFLVMENVIQGMERKDIIALKRIEKSIALYGNSLSFLGVAIPIFIEILFPNTNACKACEDSSGGVSTKQFALWLGVLLLVIILWGIRHYSELVWARIVALETTKAEEEKEKWEELKSMIGCTCSVSRESCSCPQRAMPPSKP